MKNILVYRHRTLDTKEIFYVGIGSYKRAKEKYKRSNFWKNVSKKHGYSIEIVKITSWEEACELEQLLILEYGRRDLNLGTLVNLTNGGEGSPGTIVSKETRLKLRKVNLGRPLKEEHRRKISLSQKGNQLSLYAKQRQKEVVSKKVINTQSGIIYNSVKELSDILNINYLNLNRRLNGKVKNNTYYKYLKDE